MADTDVKLSVGLNTGDVRQDARELAKEVDAALKADSNTKNSKIQNLDKDMIKSVENAKKLSAELDALSNKQIPTTAYKEISAELDKANTKWENLLTRQERYQELGKNPPKTLLHDLEVAEEKSHRLEMSLKDLERTGKAFKLGSETDEFAKKSEQLNDINNKTKVQLVKHKEITSEGKKQSATFEKLKTVFSKVGGVIKSIGSGLASLGSKVVSLAGKVKNVVSQWISHRLELNRNNNSMKGLVKNLLKYGLGIRSVFVLVNKLRNAISEGVSNLVLFNNGLNSTNVAVSRVQSSVQYLKNALGAMASPIIQLVTPALEMMIDRVAKLANMIAAVVSSLTGKKTVTVAKKTAVNAAANSASGKSSQNAAEKAQEKYENAKKKAEEKYAKQMSAVQEKRAKAQAKAEERQAKAAKKYADAQEKANEALGNYDKLNVIATESAQELEEIQADTYDDPVMDEVNPEDYLSDLGGLGDGVANMFEEVPIDSILSDTIKDWIDRLKEAWKAGDWEGVGAIIAEGLNSAMTTVDNWINEMRSKAVEWASNIARIGNGFVEAFDWSLLGKTVADGLNALADIINTFLTTFDFEALGSGIGEAIKSWFDNIEWDLMGQLFANKWNALINLIYGIVTTPGLWESIGTSIAEFISNWFDTIDWEKLALTLIAGVNGIITALRTAIANIPWTDMGSELGEHLKQILDGIHWDELGQMFAEAINVLVGFLKSFVETPGLWNSTGKAIADAIIGLFTTISWDDITSLLTESFNGLITSLDTIITELPWANAGTEFSNQIHNLITGVNWKNVGKTLSDLFIGILDFLTNLDIDQATDDFYTALVDLIEGVDWIKLGGKLLELVIKLIEAGFSIQFHMISAVADLIGDVFDELGLTGIGDFFHGISDGIKDVWNWIKTNVFEPVVNAIKGLFGINSPSTVFEGFGTNLIEGLKNGISNTWSKITDFFEDKIGKLKEKISQKFEKFKQNGETLIKKINAGFKERYGSDIQNFLSDKFSNLKDNLSKKAEKFNTVGKNIVAGLKEGISEKWESFKSWASEKFSGLKRWAEDALDINSPSKVFQKIGQFVTEGLAIGIDDGSTNAEKAIENVAENIIDTMNDTSDSFIFDPVNNEVLNSLTLVVDRLQTMADVFDSISKVIDGINGKNITIPDIAVGKIVPTQMAVTNAGGGSSVNNDELKLLLQQLLERMDENNSQNMPTVELTLDGKRMARAVFDEQEKRYRQLGQYTPSYV